MFRSHRFQNGSISIAGAPVEIVEHVTQGTLSAEQIAHLESSPAWTRVETPEPERAPSPPRISEETAPELAEAEAEKPKRRRGRPKKKAPEA